MPIVPSNFQIVEFNDMTPLNHFIAIVVTIASHGHSSSFNKEFEVNVGSLKEAYETGKRFCKIFENEKEEGVTVKAAVIVVEKII